MYGGGILVAAGWSVIFASIVGGALTVLLVLLFELKSHREEAWLVDHYPGYDDYRRRTRRRFLPFVL
jgi:protein-S-isoprenylcysteine O-methyltransferase Ste14